LIILSTGSLHSYGLNRVFDLAARAGFHGVEVLLDQRWDTRQADYLRHLQVVAGIPIVSLHSPFVSGIQGWEHDQLSRLKRTVALASELGARHVVAHLPFRFAYVWLSASWFLDKPVAVPLPAPNRDREYGRFLREELATCEKSTGVTVVVENLPCRRLGPLRYNGYRMNTLEEWGRLPSLNFDTTHLATWGLDILATYERLKPRIRHIHLSNYNGKEHRLPWDGDLPLKELLRRLTRDQYSGYLCVELDPESLGAAEETEVLENLRRACAFCAEHLGGLE